MITKFKAWTVNMIALCISYKQHSKTFSSMKIFISNNIECIPATGLLQFISNNISFNAYSRPHKKD